MHEQTRVNEQPTYKINICMCTLHTKHNMHAHTSRLDMHTRVRHIQYAGNTVRCKWLYFLHETFQKLFVLAVMELSLGTARRNGNQLFLAIGLKSVDIY